MLQLEVAEDVRERQGLEHAVIGKQMNITEDHPDDDVTIYERH